MTNAELIKALRWCGSEDDRHEMCVDESYSCPLWNENRITDDCKAELMTTAADALEAAEKRIKELESQAAFFDAEKLNYQENIEYRDERIKELEARLKTVTDCHTFGGSER